MLCRVNSGLLPVQVLAHDRGLPGHRRGRRELPAPHRCAQRARLPPARVRGRRRRPAPRRATSPRSRAGRTGAITAKVIDTIRNRRRWTLATLRAQATRSTRPTPIASTCSPTTSTGSASSSTAGDAAAVAAFDPRRRRARRRAGHARQLGPRPRRVAPRRRHRAARDRGRASRSRDVRDLAARAPAGRDRRRRPACGRAGDALDRPPGEGPRVGAGDRARRARGPDAASPHRRHRGRAPGVPRRAHPVPRRRSCCSPTRPRPRRSSTSSRPSPRRCSPRSRGPRRRLERSRRTAPSGSFVGAGAAGRELAADRRAAGLAARTLPRPTACPPTSCSTTRRSTRSRPRKPGSTRELARISGIGPTKLERYGDDILEIVSNDS